MPKLGRRVEVAELEYQWRENMTTSFAPFGTHDTPQMRTKIVGGKPVMVAEDRKRTTIPSEEPLPPQLSPGKMGNGGTSPRLAPMTEKPNYVEPKPFMAANNSRSPQSGFINQQQDGRSQHESPSSLNPHSLVPPIGPSSIEPNSGNHKTTIPPAPYDITELLRYQPKDSFLPPKPVNYTKKEELELRRRVHQDLKGFDPRRFKDVYTELAGYDRQLTGFISTTDLGNTLSKYQVPVGSLHLRLLAAMFISPTESGKINYEKVLSFLAASQRDASTMPAGGPVTDPNASLEEELKAQGIYYNAITHQHEDFRRMSFIRNTDAIDPYRIGPRSNKFPFNDRENAKLLRYLETQLAQASEPVDVEKCWSNFTMADRGMRGTLSKDQISQLCQVCNIPLQDSLISAILTRCDETGGQYKWEQFLEFLGRVVPRKTGLKIPESKKPLEYAKQYPQPGSSWPKGEWDNTDYGIPRNQFRKPANFPNSAPKTDHHTPLERQGYSEPGPTRLFSAVSITTDGSASEMGESLLELLKEESPPMADPNDLLPTWNPRGDSLEELESRVQRQTNSDRRQRDLDVLEQQYDREMKQGQTQSAPKEQYKDSEPWFDRFMKLANAVYTRDSESSGKLGVEEFQWIVEEYNRSYNLGLNEGHITNLLKTHTRDKIVTINPVLKELGLHRQ